MKYGPQFSQHLTPQDLAAVSKACTYEGDAPDLKHLRGLILETATVESVVYVGERENIWATLADGTRIRPWMGCWINEHDAEGNEVLNLQKSAWQRSTVGPNAMTKAELNGLGFTENELIDLVKTHLGETYVPDGKDPSDLRRHFFNRVAAVLYGP